MLRRGGGALRHPEEVAAAYLETEITVARALGTPVIRRTSGPWARFFGIVADARGYGALFYLILSLLTGTLYFTLVAVMLPTGIGLLPVRGCHHPAPVLRDHPGALARRGTDHGGVAGRAHAAQAPGSAARGPRVRPGEALAHRSAHLDEHPVHGAATAPRHRVLHDRGRRAVAVGGRCGLPDRAVVHELPAATSWSWPRCGESRRRARRGPARPQTPLWPSPRSGRFEQQTTKAPAGDRGLRVAHVRMRATCRATRPQGHGSQRRSATPQRPPLPDRCRTR